MAKRLLYMDGIEEEISEERNFNGFEKIMASNSPVFVSLKFFTQFFVLFFAFVVVVLVWFLSLWPSSIIIFIVPIDRMLFVVVVVVRLFRRSLPKTTFQYHVHKDRRPLSEVHKSTKFIRIVTLSTINIIIFVILFIVSVIVS